MSATSASVRGRFTFAGLPMTSDRGGIRMSSTTSEPAATIDPLPTCDPFNRIAPIPMRQRSSIVQPWTTAACPIVTSSPTVVACVSFITWMIVPSCTLDRRPIRIRWTSPRMTTAIQTLLSSAISTSPITCALSSM
jgi:hypothetical protein